MCRFIHSETAYLKIKAWETSVSTGVGLCTQFLLSSLSLIAVEYSLKFGSCNKKLEEAAYWVTDQMPPTSLLKCSVSSVLLGG